MDKTNSGSPPQPAATETASFGISGMTCDHCARRVDRALRGLPGVKDVTVDRPGAVATVTFDPSEVDLPALHAAVSPFTGRRERGTLRGKTPDQISPVVLG